MKPHSTKKHTIDSFIDKANKIHNGYYSYEKVKYVNNKTKVIIVCSKHGDFEQVPCSHLRGNGCNFCGIEDKITTKNRFIEKAEELHGKRYDYSKSNYVDSRIKITISCKIHGDFEQKPTNHLQGNGCPKCGRKRRADGMRKTQKEFLDKAKKLHNNFYSYEKTNYFDTRDKIIITCPIHGDFKQQAGGHLQGFGCVRCASKGKGGFNREAFIKTAKGRLCTFYIIRCFNENEEFYKIGITTRTIEERYKTIKEMPYNYEIVSEIFGEAGEIWDMERKKIKKLKDFHYQPKIDFGGAITECFNQY